MGWGTRSTIYKTRIYGTMEQWEAVKPERGKIEILAS